MNDQKNAPSVSFGGVMTALITLATMIFSGLSENLVPSGVSKDTLNWVQAFMFIMLYLLMALMSDDDKPIIDVITGILYINEDDDYEIPEKLSLIKDHLGLFSDKLTDMFLSVRKLLHGWSGFKENLKFVLKKVYNGRITVHETAWLFAYISYRVTIATGFLEIPLPMNIMISVGAIFGLSLTSGNMAGIGELVGDLFNQVNGDKEDKSTMSRIMSTIRLLCVNYNRITKSIEAKTGKSVMEFMYGGSKKSNV